MKGEVILNLVEGIFKFICNCSFLLAAGKPASLLEENPARFN